MHKQHEDQPSNELLNLSTWHRVPVGATIPAGTPYAYAYENGITVELDGYPCDKQIGVTSHYTERPIAPPLPTEEGATIVASGDERPPHILLTRKDGRWVNLLGRVVRLGRITSWAPVTIGEAVFRP